MELNFPEPYCRYNPDGHYYLLIDGTIWRCKYCWAVKWLPDQWSETMACSIDIQKLGIQTAYKKWLIHRSKAKELLMKLEEMRLLREIMPEKERVRAIAAVVAERKVSDD